MLAKTHDPRAAPALAKALDDCGADAKPAAESVKQSAVEGRKVDRVVIDSLWTCSTKPGPARAPKDDVARAVGDAVLGVKDPSYAPKAIAALESTSMPDYAQLGCIDLIGGFADKSAVRPLVTVLMTRQKLALEPRATDVLATMPREAVPVLSSALDGGDPDFAKKRGEWARDDGYIPIIVAALASTSLDSARDAVLAALPNIDRDANRAAAAQSLVWFQNTPQVTSAYRAAYARLPAIVEHGGADTGIERAALLQAASDLFDASLVTWVLDESAHATGETLLAAKASALQSAIKLMQVGDKKAVERAIDALENRSGLSAAEKHEIADNVDVIYGFASKALDACDRDVGCYVKILDEAIPPAANANWKAIKAAMMCGLLGDERTRKDLVARAASVKNPGVRQAMAIAILHLAPKGDALAARVLDTAAGTDEVFARVARMLRARAGP